MNILILKVKFGFLKLIWVYLGFFNGNFGYEGQIFVKILFFKVIFDIKVKIWQNFYFWYKGQNLSKFGFKGENFDCRS